MLSVCTFLKALFVFVCVFPSLVALGNAEARRPQRLCFFESGPNLHPALAAALPTSTTEERRPRAAPATGASRDPGGELATTPEPHLCIVFLGSHPVLHIHSFFLCDLSGLFFGKFNATLCSTNCTFWTNFVHWPGSVRQQHTIQGTLFVIELQEWQNLKVQIDLGGVRLLPLRTTENGNNSIKQSHRRPDEPYV